MSKSARRLGRGLQSLISPVQSEQESAAHVPRESKPSTPTERGNRRPIPSSGAAVQAAMIRMDEIATNPFQPRDMSLRVDVLSLAKSIRQAGLIQPITVRPKDRGFQIVAGERRWHAAKSLGFTEIPAIVRDATDEQMLELALIENIQREDLNAIDRARAYRQFATQFNLKPEEIARRLGEDRTTVTNYLRLLDLSDDVQRMVAEGKISMGHARCLLSIAEPERRSQLARSVADHSLSVRALEEMVRRESTRAQRGSQLSNGPDDKPRTVHLRDLQRRFEEALKTRVTIHEGKRKGTGRIVIDYYSLDDFDRFASLMGVRLE